MMAYLILFAFLVVPFVILVSSPFWFWRLGLLRQLEARARSIANDQTGVPATKTIAEFCTASQNGHKVVVVHHLADVADDQYGEFILVSTGFQVFSWFTLFIVGFYQIDSSKLPDMSVVDFLKVLISRVSLLALSATTFLPIVINGVNYITLLRQLRKYRAILN